jgi:predicted peptidase
MIPQLKPRLTALLSLALLSLLTWSSTYAAVDETSAESILLREVRMFELEDTVSPYGYVLIKNVHLASDDSSERVPLIISLHGSGGGKKGLEGLKIGDEKYFADAGHSYLYIKPATIERWEPDALNALIDTVLVENEALIDPKRIYLYGYSMGGYGSWRYCIDYGYRIAAMMAIAGGFREISDVATYDFKYFKDLPVWAFHNRDDQVVPLIVGQTPIDAAKAVGGNPKFTINESGKHKIQLSKNFTEEVLDWLFAQSR